MFGLFKKSKSIGIGCEYDREDDRLVRLSAVKCMAVNKDGKKEMRTVMVSEAERYVIEAIATRLFLDHKKVVKRERTEDGRVRLVGRITYEMQ